MHIRVRGLSRITFYFIRLKHVTRNYIVAGLYVTFNSERVYSSEY